MSFPTDPTAPRLSFSFGDVADVYQGASPSQPVYRTTSGSQFRCNPVFDVTKLQCSQCSGDKAHIVEAKPLRSRLGTEHLPKGIVDMLPFDEDPSGLRLIADVKCARRDAPFESFPVAEDLTQIAQQNSVICAHQLPGGGECGELLMLSELPGHHHLLHSKTVPQSSSAQQNILPAMTSPSVTAISSPSGAARTVPVTKVTTPHLQILPRSGCATAENVHPVLPARIDQDNKIAKLTDQITILSRKNEQLEEALAKLSIEVADQSNVIKRLQITEQFGLDRGMFFWQVPNFRQVLQDTVRGNDKAIHSDYFYSPKGCKLNAKIVPNGDGVASGKYVSIFLSVMKTDNDSFISWPFSEKVCFTVVGHDGKNLHYDAFKPDFGSSSFVRPLGHHNTYTGVPRFLPLDGIDQFLVDGDLLIKITVGHQAERSLQGF